MKTLKEAGFAGDDHYMFCCLCYIQIKIPARSFSNRIGSKTVETVKEEQDIPKTLQTVKEEQDIRQKAIELIFT